MALRFFQTHITIYRLTWLDIPRDFNVSFCSNRPDRLWGHPAGGFCLRRRAAVNPTTHFQLVPMLGMDGATLPLPPIYHQGVHLCFRAYPYCRQHANRNPFHVNSPQCSVSSAPRSDITSHRRHIPIDQKGKYDEEILR